MQNQAELQIVPIGQVQESWSNPRKHFAKDTLAELTTSVKEKGILVPLLVRPIMGHGIGTQHGTNIDLLEITRYEVVAGERRLRAARRRERLLSQTPVREKRSKDEKQKCRKVRDRENAQRWCFCRQFDLSQRKRSGSQ
jgi:ParB/RepB/Spo0J family partition protein